MFFKAHFRSAFRPGFIILTFPSCPASLKSSNNKAEVRAPDDALRLWNLKTQPGKSFQQELPAHPCSWECSLSSIPSVPWKNDSRLLEIQFLIHCTTQPRGILCTRSRSKEKQLIIALVINDRDVKAALTSSWGGGNNK